MIILNGRSFCDKDIGKNTCKNASVIDYVLTSSNLIKRFSNFKIAEFCELYSDAHCPIEFSLRSDTICRIDKQSNFDTKIKPWDERKKSDYNMNID